MGVDEVNDYVFAEKTKLFSAYLIGRLNADLHSKTVHVEHKNGFEPYRQTCQIVDAVPENAKFHMSTELMALTKNYRGKVVELRTLSGLRLTLKTKIAEFKKVIGEEPAYRRSWRT